MSKAADDAIPGRSTAGGAASRWMRAASPALRVAVAAAAPPGSPLHARIPALARDVESWPAALALAREHRLDGFLARWLTTAGRALVAAATAAELDRGLLALARREREMLAEQRAIRQALAARGIASLPYKGPSLARRLHDPSFVRYSRDLDLFVPAGRVEEAAAVLGDAYAMLDGSPEMDEAGNDHHILLRRRDRGLLVELHWELAPAGWGAATAALIGPPECWPMVDADEAGALGSETAAGAGADDGWPLARLLPSIAAHGVRHGYARLVWLGDVAAIVHRHPDLDWDETWRVASASGVATALAASLLLAERVFAVAASGPAVRGAAPVAALSGAAAAAGAAGLAPRALAAWLEGRVATGRTAWDPIARGVLQSLSSDGWPRRARLATRLALAPTSLDQATLPLPAGLRWLHVPLRPALVASRFLARRAANAGREGARSS